MAVQNLKAELHQARRDTPVVISGCEGIEETIEAEQGESSKKGQEISKGNCGVFNSPK